MTAAKERKLLVWFFVLVAILTSVPYLVGFSSQTDDWRFSGFLIGVDDGNSYIAKMLRGSEGDWVFRSPYSILKQQGLLVFLPYLWLGKFASPPATHTQLVLLFQIFRIAGLGIYIYGINRFMRLFSLSSSLRMLGVFLATVGAGTGWLMLFFQGYLPGDGIPLEFTSPETFGFLSIFTLPHLSTATGMLFISVEQYLTAATKDLDDPKRKINLIVGGAALFIVGIFQLIDVAVGLFLMAIIFLLQFIQHWGLIKNQVKIVWEMTLSLLPAFGWVVYVLIAARTDPYFIGWNAQNTISSPAPIYYLFSLGVFYLFLVINYQQLRVAITTLQGKLILIWSICIPILVYLPLSIQRRLSVGVWVAILVFLILILEIMTKTRQKIWIGVLVLITLPSTILLWVTSLYAARNLTTPIFVPRDYVDAYEYLGQQGSDVKVLTLFRTGNEMPAWVPVSVTLGLGPESVPYMEMKDLADEFYSGASTTTDRSRLINNLGVRFGIIGEREIIQYPSINGSIDNSKTIHSSESVRIVEILP